MKYSEACEVLGLDELEPITVQMLRKAYKVSSLKHHPDRCKGSQREVQQASKKFARISDAYNVLSDPGKRRMYDVQSDPRMRDAFGGGADGADPFAAGGYGMPPQDPFPFASFGSRKSAAGPPAGGAAGEAAGGGVG